MDTPIVWSPMLAAYAGIVVLTCILVLINIHATVLQYIRDHSVLRLVSFIGTLLIAGALIISVSYLVISNAMDAQDSLLEGKGKVARAVARVSM
jgi:hypothetical protein